MNSSTSWALSVLTSVEDSPSKFLHDPASFKEVLHAEHYYVLHAY